MGKDSNKTDYGARVPDFEIEELARIFLPEIRKFYESEEGQRLFEEWKEKQDSKKI